MFGGWDPGEPGSGGEFLKDIWKFDVGTKQWTLLDIDLPFPVSRHSACTVTGGTEDDNEKIVLVTYQGVMIFQLDENNDPVLAMVECTGEAPLGLSMSAQVPMGSHGVLLFGGATKTKQM